MGPLFIVSFERASGAPILGNARGQEEAGAHRSDTSSRLSGSWDWDGAEDSFRRAIELNPSYYFAYQVYGYLLALRGRTREGLTHTQTSLELNPFEDITLLDRAELTEWLGEPDKAQQHFETTIELYPDFAQAHQGLGRVLCSTGRIAQGLVAFERARTLSPDDEFIAGDMGHCYAVSGRAEEARRLLDELAGRAQRTYVSPVAPTLLFTVSGGLLALLLVGERLVLAFGYIIEQLA